MPRVPPRAPHRPSLACRPGRNPFLRRGDGYGRRTPPWRSPRQQRCPRHRLGRRGECLPVHRGEEMSNPIAEVIQKVEERFSKVAPAYMKYESEKGFAIQLMDNSPYLKK